MKAFKGFNQDMTCRNFQYEENGEYETPRAKICDEGFHACKHPLDVFDYYDPAHSIYHEVELDGSIDERSGNKDTKVAATKIKIGARLSIAAMVKAAIDFTFERVKKEAASDEEQGASSATGDYGASSATGDYGASSATGACGASSATGYKGASSADEATAVAVAWGYMARAKGVIGAHLVLSNWEYSGPLYDDGTPRDWEVKENWTLKGAKMIVIDGKKFKENTWYRCINNKIIEVNEQGDPIEECKIKKYKTIN